MNTINKVVEETIAHHNAFERAYLFGSVLRSEITTHDIDILLIYENRSKKLFENIDSISVELENLTGLVVDITALSVDEERSTAFLERIAGRFKRIK